jgi:glycosyltransferase involved in cell wall biosynthesis
MIKLYTCQDLLQPENRREVHPLLFDLHYYEQAHSSVFQNYCLVEDPNEADAFIFPLNYFSIPQKGYQTQYDSLYELARSNNKKLIVYTGGDYGKTFNDKVIITWRNAGFKSLNDRQSIIIPAFMSDPLERDDLEFKVHEYKEEPQASFTGFANPSFKEQLRITVSTLKANWNRWLKKDKSDTQSIYNAAGKRFTYLKELESNPRIKTDFIYRDKYRAGATTQEQRETSTAVFFKNLNDSPYTFCLRGAGNFSVRFYESLALGKIPVLIDTDVQLPLEQLIEWDQHICRVAPHENVVEQVLEFHKSHSATSFKALQISNRSLYENYLIRHAYFCKLHDLLKALL